MRVLFLYCFLTMGSCTPAGLHSYDGFASFTEHHTSTKMQLVPKYLRLLSQSYWAILDGCYVYNTRHVISGSNCSCTLSRCVALMAVVMCGHPCNFKTWSSVAVCRRTIWLLKFITVVCMRLTHLLSLLFAILVHLPYVQCPVWSDAQMQL